MRFMSHEMEDDVSVLVMKYLSSIESEKEEARAIKEDFLASMEQLEQEAADVEMLEDAEFVEDVPDADEIISDNV